MKVSFFLILLFIQNFSQAANCPPKYSMYKQTQEMRNKIKYSPFIYSCQNIEEYSNQIPENGITHRSIPLSDKTGLTAKEFLLKLHHQIQERLLNSEQTLIKLKSCAFKNTLNCQSINNWIQNDLKKYIKSARYNLSLAQSEFQWSTWQGKASEEINQQLSPLGLYKLENWEPLTDAETQKAKIDLDDYKKQIEAEVQTKIQSKEIAQGLKLQAQNNILLSLRYQHFVEYRQIMAEVPFLQYLTRSDFNASDLNYAFKEMTTKIEKEKKYLAELKKQINQNPINTSALSSMDYRTDVESLLLNEPKFCAIASGLHFTKSNRSLGNALASAAVLLPLSYYAAPLALRAGTTQAMATGASVGLGATMGAGFTLLSYNDFKKVKQRTLIHTLGDKEGLDQEDLRASYKEVQFTAATAPLGLGIMGFSAQKINQSVAKLFLQKKLKN